MKDYIAEHYSKDDIIISDFALEGSGDERMIVRKAIVCKDGFKISVQQSEGHYSSPSSGGDYFEVLGGNRRHPEGYVHRDRINASIHRHGGPARG